MVEFETQFYDICFPELKIEKIVRFAREAGYDSVEIRVDKEHKHEVSSRSSSEERRYVKKLFDGEGIKVSCIAYPDSILIVRSKEGNIFLSHLEYSV